MLAQDDKVLFVFSDPGGAKPLLALITISGLINYRVVSDRVYSFYEDFGIPVHPFMGDVQEEVRSFKPSKIFTATSYTSDIEKKFLVYAKKHNIHCTSFIDHWTNISSRFLLNDNSKVYPDEVWLLDDHAREIAIQEGMSESKLIVSGNPFLLWLKNWKPAVSKEMFFKILKIQDIETKILLYAPDPLSNDGGEMKYGFDEVMATEEFCAFHSKYPHAFNGWKILIKPHPNQNISLLENIIPKHNRFIFVNRNLNTNNCLYYSDIVVGYYSSILIEGTILGKKILRYIPKHARMDPLKEQGIGTVLSSMEELQKYLTND